MGTGSGPAGAWFSVGAMVTGSGPGLRFSGLGFISGAKHDFLYQLFMLIPNF